MPTINLQIQDVDGNIVKEKTMELREGSNLIIRIPNHYADTDDGIKLIDDMANTFNNNLGDGGPIFVPEDFELFVLTVKS